MEYWQAVIADISIWSSQIHNQTENLKGRKKREERKTEKQTLEQNVN